MRVDRRTFLRAAAGWVVSVPGLAALVSACTGRTASPAPSTPPPPTSPPSSTVGRGWDDLASGLRGELIRPGQPAYATARLAYDPRFDDLHPEAVVRAASTADVSRTIRFAREHDLPFAARSGGHSYGGYSLTDGIVIDVSAMSAVVPEPTRGRATVGTGATLIDVAAALAPGGMTIPGGTCATVGIGGLTLGGGQGVTSRRFGLTCDSLRAATVVLADGSVVTCDRSHDADLFWALRGGGGGNVGVVTSFTFSTHPLSRLTAFSLSWPWDAAADVLDAWETWGPSGPDDLWSSCRLRWIPGSGPQVSVSGAWAGLPAALAPHLDELSSSASAAPSRSTQTMSYLEAARYYAGCNGYTIDQCKLGIRGGLLKREAALAKSDFFDARLGSDVAAAMLGWIERRGSDDGLAGDRAGVIFDGWGGRIAGEPSDATAFPHRNARFLAQEFVTFTDVPSGDGVAANRRWLTGLWRSLRPAASGFAYVNYIDPDLRGWQHAYYGANLPKLVGVKRTYDPDDVFRFAQSIPTALPT